MQLGLKMDATVLKKDGKYLVGCDPITGDQIWGMKKMASVLSREVADRASWWLKATVVSV
jgi:hypothetical protein